ncbi:MULTISPECIES: flagellar biosynthetic protein FliR [Malaciobacter]|uniref:Flagellar biosynthesis protein FliR n=2 Tax=Malaciobacter TaxID=2321114 RepID=A0A347TMX6_9BACT|nr:MULTISPECIES: flagellar biosynthetic protein FliR [Malaciobacter]AXX87954.1 flagellar export apparatus, transmembrane gate complex, FliR component [Malaciobacter marinus]PHO10004.1 flagellar biosynthesis protein FliR [Malaciobacter canalis]PHO13255.1 flagellar biosynthesis protein FliR [Malaciobacter marinus]PHO16008.1 flagellar biosynthesis protein FliR [Malaciobacter marinus]QEE33700.1 flagellar export apparatus, transmembrane gate complex, FliR component [Malaciobacter canalis]
MEAFLSLLNEAVVIKFLLLLARILSFVAFMPVYGHSAVSPKIRVTFAFFVTIFLFPIIEVKNLVTQDMFVLSLISEITLGAVAAFFVHIIFSAVRIIGELIEYSTALSMANMFDPATGTQEGVVNRFLYMVALVLFFETGMYEMTFVILVKSFSIIHLGYFDIFSYDGIQIIIDEINRLFAFSFSFALPLFFIAFILDLYYGYGTRSMPAFSPFVITFQLKFAVIFLFLIFGMEIFTHSFTNFFINKFQ